MTKRLLLYFVSFYCVNFSYGQPGKIDSLFGTNGIVKTDFGFSFDYNYATKGRQVLTQPDGSLYILIEAANLSYITKRLSNGTVDQSYGNNGFSNPIRLLEASAAIQSDGKIVVVGVNVDGSFTVARYDGDGNLDKTYNKDGKQVGDFGYTENVANSVAIQNDGKIVVAGYVNTGSSWDFAIARFTSDGRPDTSFDNDGKQTTDFGGTDDQGYAIAIQNNGKIVMVGQTAPDGVVHDFAIARYNIDGSLDKTFSGDGKKITDFDSSEDIARSVAVQSDGKIVVAGYVYKCNSSTCSNAEFAVARYTTNGNPDNSFSTDGKQTTAFLTGYFTTSLLIQPNGKIVVGGYGYPGNSSTFALARFNTNGSIDNTFNGDGKQTTEFNGNSYANSISLQSDGKIVATGWDDNSTFDIARYNIDGAPDNSFGIDGKLSDRLHLQQGSTLYTSTAIQNDGKIVAAGYTWNGSNYDFALARYNVNGGLDNTFSNDGKQTTDFDSLDDYAYSLAIQKDGKIILAGVADSNFALARYNADGSPDSTFGNGGKETTDLGYLAYDEARSIVVQDNGKIIVAGLSLDEIDNNTFQFISDFAVAVYNPNGSPDNSFSDDGKLITNLGYDDIANSVAVQPDGKILVAGESQDSRREVSLFSVTRYNVDGSLDESFSGDGKQFTNFGGISHANSIALQNDGKIIVAGNTGSGQGLSDDFAIARYNIDGSPDKTFSKDGIQTTHLGAVYSSNNPVLVQADGKILVGGGSNGDFTLVRYNPDGSPDKEFSDDGIQTTNVSDGDDVIESMAIRDNKLYAAGYGQYPGNLGVVVRYLLTPGVTLPVSLIDFTAVLKDKTVQLSWQTSGEQNLSRFIIERSNDGSSFLPIGTQAAAGNSAHTIRYSAIDQQPLQGVNFYRLKMPDNDGNFTYSKIIAIKAGGENNAFQIFPNPAKNVLFVQATGNNANTAIQIIDVNGRMVREQIINAGANILYPLNISMLPKGIYNMVLHGKGKVKVQKFVKD